MGKHVNIFTFMWWIAPRMQSLDAGATGRKHKEEEKILFPAEEWGPNSTGVLSGVVEDDLTWWTWLTKKIWMSRVVIIRPSSGDKSEWRQRTPNLVSGPRI